MNLADLRRSYTKSGLTEEESSQDPFTQFELWFEQARSSGNPEPNAMTVATASADGVPNARTVLLKGFSPEGFIFYTNYESQKGTELRENSRAALLFYWPELERQVRVQGTVELVARDVSEKYFRTRPAGHRLGAWASKQSSVVAGRQTLETNLAEVTERFGFEDIPLPPFWGGYRVVPVSIEFWQGRTNRLHDRLEYVRAGNGWERRRLAP